VKIINIKGEWYLLDDSSDDIVLTKLDADKTYTVQKKTQKARSALQNASLHLYLSKLATALNSAGYDIKKTLSVDVAWTMTSAKELLWRQIQKVMTAKNSSTELKSDEVTTIYRTLNKITSERYGVSVEFPSTETLIREQNGENLH